MSHLRLKIQNRNDPKFYQEEHYPKFGFEDKELRNVLNMFWVLPGLQLQSPFVRRPWSIEALKQTASIAVTRKMSFIWCLLSFLVELFQLKGLIDVSRLPLKFPVRSLNADPWGRAGHQESRPSDWIAWSQVDLTHTMLQKKTMIQMAQWPSFSLV